MAGYGTSSFHDQVQRARNQIRSALEDDDDAESEWFDGTMSETAASQTGSQQPCILGQHVMPQVGDHVMVLDPQLTRWLGEATGTILEVRCDGGHVKVEHDGAGREERYYNTGKDGVYQLALAPPMPSLVAADARPRFSLPRPPSKLDRAAATPTPQAATPSNVVQQRPRYSEVRRAGSQSPRTPAAAPAASVPVVEPEPMTRSNSVSSSRPRYSELRKARKSQAMGSATEVSCSSSIGTGEPVQHPHGRQDARLQVPSVGQPALTSREPGLDSANSTPKTRSRYSELRKASRSPVRCPTAPSEHSLPKSMSVPQEPSASSEKGEGRSAPVTTFGEAAELLRRLEAMERETGLLTQQVKDLKALRQSDLQLIRDECRKEVDACEQRCRASCKESNRHWEAELRQFREEQQQLVAAAERRLWAQVHELNLAAPKPQAADAPQAHLEEPEQEYETPNGEEEPYYLDTERNTNETAGNSAALSRAELADSELSLQTIGSIARRVSASLGGRPNGPTAAQRDPPERRQTARPAKERPFDFEQEMEHLADMRRFASQVLGNRASDATSSARVPDHGYQGEWRDQERQDRSPRRATTPPPASPMFGHPQPSHGARGSATVGATVGRAPRTAQAVPCAERWKRRPSAREVEPPCPWESEEEVDTHPPARRSAVRQDASAFQHVDREGRLIF